MKQIDISERDEFILGFLQKGSTLERRAHKVLIQLLLNYEFKSLVQSVRKNLDINPENRNMAEYEFLDDLFQDSYIEKRHIKFFAYIFDEQSENEIDLFCKTYYKPSPIDPSWGDRLFLRVIKEYICLSEVFVRYFPIGEIKIIEHKNAENEICITFDPYSNQKEIIKFITDHQDEIQMLRESILNTDKKTKIKPWENFIQHIEIFETVEGVKATRNKDTETTPTTSEILAAKKLFEDKGVEISEGTIGSASSKVRQALKKANKKNILR